MDEMDSDEYSDRPAPKAPAGWYPDTDGVERYWNGEAWQLTEKATEDSRDKSHVPPGPEVGVPTRPASATEVESGSLGMKTRGDEEKKGHGRFSSANMNWLRVTGYVVLAAVLVASVVTAVSVGAADRRHAARTSQASVDDDAGEDYLAPAPEPPAAGTEGYLPTAPEPPDGFDHITSSGVAWSWDNDQSDGITYCYGQSCVIVHVEATEGCSSLYVEANMMNADDQVLGITNGMTGVLAPGEEALVPLIFSQSAATQARITTIDCE